MNNLTNIDKDYINDFILLYTDWLAVSLSSKYIAPDSSDIAIAKFNANSLGEGIYAGNIYLESNDQDNSRITIPHTLTATQTGIKNNEMISIPSVFTLNQNYPDPFNAVTVIRYSLPEPSNVLINIYDILGRKLPEIRITPA